MEINDKLKIIQNNIIPILKNTNFINLTKLNNLSLLDNIYVLIKKYVNEKNQNKIEIKKNKTIIYPIHFKSKNKFISQYINNYILSKLIYQEKVTINLNNREIQIYISSENKIKKNEFLNFINKIILIIKVFDNLSNEKLDKLDLFIFLTKFKKTLPKNNKDVISSLNVNSGYTTFYSNFKEIVIYRKEELFKVLIHELMHYYDFDIKKTINYMQEKIFINNCFKLYGETYIEVWARILNIVFLSAEKTKNYDDYSNFLRISLYIESLFSYFQGLKILKYNNITFNTLRTRINKINNYNEESNSYCYYVLTSLLMFNIDTFLKLCYKNNFNLIKFNKLDYNHKELLNLILNILYSNKFINLERKLNKNKIENNTLRMSIIE